MHVIAKKALRDFYEGGHDVAKEPMLNWYRTVEKATWTSFSDVRRTYPSVDLVGGNKLVFNVGGNRYRIICKLRFPYQTLFIKWVGTHREYDNIRVEEL